MVKNVIWIPSSLLLCFTGFILCANDRLASRRFCGYQHSDEYSRDSPNVTINEFPWVAQLLYDDKRRVRCTGSLINNRYVLTSAQCVSNNQNLVGVRLGDFNRTSVEDCVHHTIFGEECSEPVQEFEIDEIIPHPKFNKSTSEDDIAVIRLSHNAQYTDYIRPICLPIPGSRDIGDKELALSGWGILGRLQNITEVKKKILASFVGLEECNAVYNKSGRTPNENNICAIEKTGRSCHGDGGGPLMLSVRNQWEVVGILLYGVGCGMDAPSVYLNVANYVEWIQAQLKI